jgi:hypothetical protein
MHELSGDLLQQFCSVLFNKLDRGEPWDDYYELNTMLQVHYKFSDPQNKHIGKQNLT